jgi:hypothetical protein
MSVATQSVGSHWCRGKESANDDEGEEGNSMNGTPPKQHKISKSIGDEGKWGEDGNFDGG